MLKDNNKYFSLEAEKHYDWRTREKKESEEDGLQHR